MCGIAGFIDKKSKFGKGKKEALVKDMLGLIEHRGGDSRGISSNDNVTIGHSRLSIVDTSSRANQPLTNNDYALSFNGEIYNHNELRKHYLDKKKIDSPSDTATLFELIGNLPVKKVLEIINGMYAFSFLDIKNLRVVLALDKLAIKPLYYVDTPGYFAWASEAKAFKALPNFKFEFEESCLDEYLTFRYIAGEKTLFKNIRKVLPGEFIIYSLRKNTFRKKLHSRPAKKRPEPKLSLEKTIKESAISHLMGDNPVGIQLSGGVDSSIVALFAQNSSLHKLHSFSIGLKDKNWNEFYYSDQIAKIIGTKHHKIIFSKTDFVKLFSKLTYHLDEPIVHPNTIPMFLLAKEARKYAKVLLTGEGADELFHGYNRYFFSPLNSNVEILISNSFGRPEEVSKIVKNKGLILTKERKDILNQAKGLSRIDKISYYDIYTYLPHVLLRQDKAGMAANIENRVPFLYGPVVESAFNLKTKVGGLGGKTPLKEVALKYFPADLVMRKKCGFGLPVAEWLRDKEGLLPLLNALKDHPLINEYFVKREILALVEEHKKGTSDHSSLLFSIISLTSWYDIFIRNSP